MRLESFATILVLAGALAVAGPAQAQSGDVPCYTSPQAIFDPLEAAGANGALAANGFVTVAGLVPYYETTYAIDVGVWIDDTFLATTPDAAAQALRYFEHANCVFAAGRNLLTGTGINQTSLRLAGNRIRYYNAATPNAPGTTRPWGQQYHWDWANVMAGMSGIPKVNVIFMTGGVAGDPPSYGGGVGGASNGVGQGNAIVVVNPGWFANGMVSGITRNLAEDWWGLIAAHELGHAIGAGFHAAQLYDTMCCANGVGYTNAQMGTTPSEDFAVAQATWDVAVDNDADPADNYVDPYANTPNPLTNVTWSFPQISDFLLERSGGDVFVAPSSGTSFLARVLRHDWFCINGEVCLTGDFDGDGRQDLVAFTRGVTADVYVSLSTGTGFAGTGVKWHDFFAINSETPLVGDWNGDGRDDIASFTGGSAADVYVALSTGSSFSGTGVKWHNLFAPTELPVAGDWNGDGRDDLATFTRGVTGDVYVALSTGAAFSGTGVKWHETFCINAELPFADDVNGDGRDDIVSFARGTLGRVYVARSSGSAFLGTNQIWTTDLCLGADVCGLADVTGDGRADALGFHRHD